MTKKEAVSIISAIARENASAWLAQVSRNGEVYYNIEKVNRNGDFRWITLAVATEKHGRPALDFLWPCPVPQYTTDDVGVEARTLLGYSEAVTVAAKAVGFDMKRRCFTAGGGGTDMAYECLHNLATRVGYEGSLDVTHTSMNRAEGHA